jgi:uncharacterized membrane protein YeiH
MVTGIGGGMMRDILIAEVPVVLRTDFYAVAALAGAAVVVIGQVLHVSSATTMTVGALLWQVVADCYATPDGPRLY